MFCWSLPIVATVNSGLGSFEVGDNFANSKSKIRSLTSTLSKKAVIMLAVQHAKALAELPLDVDDLRLCSCPPQQSRGQQTTIEGQLPL